jgi:transcriptional regulator with XRE-family HTH domain
VASSHAETVVERVLDEQGRNMIWLARQTQFSQTYVWRMLRGERPLTLEFKSAAAKALGVPEDLLFPDSTPAAEAS